MNDTEQKNGQALRLSETAGTAPEPPTEPLTWKAIAEFKKRLAVTQDVPVRCVEHVGVALEYLESALYRGVNERIARERKQAGEAHRAIEQGAQRSLQEGIAALTPAT